MRNYFTILCLVAILQSCSSNSNNTNQATEEKGIIVQKGEVLKTEYFDITITETAFKRAIGSYYYDRPDNGNCFFTLRTIFKNTDTESRMIFDGTLILKIGEKIYSFDRTEISKYGNFGTFLDIVNPLTEKKVTFVYQIPLNLKAEAYYVPSRSDGNHMIYLGEINSTL